jgi:hypothetical protein
MNELFLFNIKRTKFRLNYYYIITYILFLKKKFCSIHLLLLRHLYPVWYSLSDKTWMISNLRCHIFTIYLRIMLLVFHILFFWTCRVWYIIYLHIYIIKKYVYFELMCHNNGKFDWSLLAFTKLLYYIIIVHHHLINPKICTTIL